MTLARTQRQTNFVWHTVKWLASSNQVSQIKHPDFLVRRDVSSLGALPIFLHLRQFMAPYGQTVGKREKLNTAFMDNSHNSISGLFVIDAKHMIQLSPYTLN